MPICTDSPLGEAINSENWNYLSERINRRFDCDFAPEEIEGRIRKSRMDAIKRGKENLGQGWLESTWFMWIKNRLVFPHGSRGVPEIRFNPLHVFFITIHEDEEMISRLWFPGEEEAMESTARSKISGSKSIDLNPINRVAGFLYRR
jgi:hypothetical protein